jgi:chemosensory pili system protein ChpA (sensor histidine kinase/response regulator)
MASNKSKKVAQPELIKSASGTNDSSWEDLLSSDDESELVNEQSLWDFPPSSDPVDDDVISPSAAEIVTLLNQIGGIVNTPSATAVTAEQTVSPPADMRQVSRTIEALDAELREAFLDDATGCVESMERALLLLESDPKHTDSLNQICRELHTLKGASASIGLTGLADHLHELEDGLRDDQTSGRIPQINALLSSVDLIRSQLAPAPTHNSGCEASNVASGLPVEEADDSCRAGSSSFTDTADDDESVRVKSSQLNRLMDMLAELVMLRNRRETELSELQEIYYELVQSVSKIRILGHEEGGSNAATDSTRLAEVANDVLDAAQRLRQCTRPVADGNAAVSQFIRQFRQELLELRRTPVAGLFRRLQRVVRDAAQAEGKNVRLQLIGEDAGIERSLQQRLYEPLLHIVRNSVCHGIEAPQTRLSAGKPAEGIITLQAHSGSDLFMIEIGDDGHGLDYDAIRRRGIDSGLLATDQDASQEELAQLIFQPGFSTRATTNQVAGRGVGMDVVATTLQRMRGWIQVDSTPRKGTQIRLCFPLPSVIQHAMVFRCAGQLFALPMQSVQSAGEAGDTAAELDFSATLGTGQAGESPLAAQIKQPIVLAARESAAAIRSRESQPIALLVDEIVGPEEVVVRPLPALLKHHPYCSGATLSGMGETVLLLDARRLVQANINILASGDDFTAHQNRSAPSAAICNQTLTRQRVLVVDDSVTARKAVVRCLRRYPLEITEASDGKQALAILRAESFAAVFSDMEMPHVSGMELLETLNAAGSANHPPVVIISSRNEDAFTNRAQQLGAAGYLIKPITEQVLDDIIATTPLLSHLKLSVPTDGAASDAASQPSARASEAFPAVKHSDEKLNER